MDHLREKTQGYYTAEGRFREMPSFENMESFGYTMLQRPLEALNIVYPSLDFDRKDDSVLDHILGKSGLSHIMNYEKTYQGNPMKYNFEYKSWVLQKFGRIFHLDHLHKYSAKMAEICRQIQRSEGIVLIYSQYIEGGIVPMALALEEMGFRRLSTAPKTSLMKKGTLPTEDPASTGDQRYIMITGDKSLSFSNTEDVQWATAKDNKDGSKVKVVLISKAGSEGIDFKYIRQIHILEPWFNIHRIEQIIGRGVRNLSHCALPFRKRNVQIFLHGTMLEDPADVETADLYLYRLAEQKAKQIGRVSRILKTTAVDCQIHIRQTHFTMERLSKLAANQKIEIELSSKTVDGTLRQVPFRIGDQDGTEICDYMSCEYQCTKKEMNRETEMTTYSVFHAENNQSYIARRIQEIYRERSAYTIQQIIQQVNVVRAYPIDQIFYVLSTFLDKPNQYILDKHGRFGTLVNQGKYYAFQPIEISDTRISLFERSKPVDLKREAISLELPKEVVPVAQVAIPNATRAYEDVIREMATQLAFLHTHTAIQSDEKNWYKNAHRVVDHLQLLYGFSKEKVFRYAVHHAIETLDYEQKRVVFENTYKKRVFSIHPEIESEIHLYFQPWVMEARGHEAIFLAKKDHVVLLKQVEGAWTEGDQEDWAEFEDAAYMVEKRKLNKIVGYVLDFKGQELAFYYKDIRLARNKKGRRCDRAGGKAPIMKTMNEYLGKHVYYEGMPEFIYSGGLCVILEMLLRDRKDILTPEQAIKNAITDFSLA